ncbi:MAG: EscU/YscU/HrcU family type III secretion system export apparatus switch protein [Gammaproteobacteria bacterium]|nr:MAG: EscU/YscU/HrcU family type III secretion system export apparatus switch protein [Gammaproteobacteria bacterium]
MSNEADNQQIPLHLKEAITLKYDGDSAPRITAKGRGLLAEKILELASANDIPLHEDADLVTLLSQLDLGEEIPRSLYLAVAEVIAFAYKMSGKQPPLKKTAEETA